MTTIQSAAPDDIHVPRDPGDTGPKPTDPGDDPTPKRPFFTRLSQAVSRYAGRPATFFGAAMVIVIWGVTGPIFGYSDTWQLIINTSTTIVTFLMVFLIQNSQNRDTAALQIKLDELIARLDGPRNALLDLENLEEEQLERLRDDYVRMAELARHELNEGSGVQIPDRSLKDIQRGGPVHR